MIAPQAKIGWYHSIFLSCLFIFSFNSLIFLSVMSSKFDLKKVARMAQVKATLKATTKIPLLTGGKGIHIGERSSKKAKIA